MNSVPDYIWKETGVFMKWLISQGAYVCHNMRRKHGRWQALLDGRGWFAPQWKDIPENVVASCRPTPIPNKRQSAS